VPSHPSSAAVTLIGIVSTGDDGRVLRLVASGDLNRQAAHCRRLWLVMRSMSKPRSELSVPSRWWISTAMTLLAGDDARLWAG
jgi:hypothetical protein